MCMERSITRKHADHLKNVIMKKKNASYYSKNWKHFVLPRDILLLLLFLPFPFPIF